MNESATTFENSSNEVSASQIISGASAGYGLFAQRDASRNRAAGFRTQASELEANARVEKINADAAANVLRERLNQTLANNAAAFSVGNIDPTSGSARIIQQQNIAEANRGFFETDLNSRIRVSALKRQAAQARQNASAELKAGRKNFIIGGVTTIAKFASGGSF
jgi:hypothetical protein